MNVLLTCAGRRNYLVQFFKQALGGRGLVIACDSSDSAPALIEADRSFLLPPLDSPEYFDVLLDLCRAQQVRLLISVFDLELFGLARNARRFREQGTVPVISSLAVIDACQDKWAAFQALRSCQIATPATFLSPGDVRRAIAGGAVRYPLFIKPRWGVSSIGVERIDNDRELDLALEWGRIQLQRTVLARMSPADAEHHFVFQECLDGDEYGMDIVNNLDGRHVATLGRRKLSMRAGNTDRAVTVDDPGLARIGKVIGERLRHVGVLDCDLIRTETGYQVIDLNPRFGGGYPFSHLAGADVPATLIAWAGGRAADPNWLRPRPAVLSSKFDGVEVVDSTRPLPAKAAIDGELSTAAAKSTANENATCRVVQEQL